VRREIATVGSSYQATTSGSRLKRLECDYLSRNSNCHTGRATEELKFDALQGQEIFLYSVQTGSGAHLASCIMGADSYLHRGKAARE
jgi:hypothetical protein